MGIPIAPRTGTEPAVDPRAPLDPGVAEPETLDPGAAEPETLDRLAHWIAVVGGAGYAPLAPGTMGSLVAALAFVAAAYALEPGRLAVGLALAIVATFAVGTWASGRAERRFGRHDDGRIVVDEVVGQWIALAPIVPFLSALDSFSRGVAVVTAFVAFRGFDIAKPGAVRWAERRFEGGLGVMADDVVAGVYGALFGAWPAGFLLRELAAPEGLA
ncbi:MAG: phosphatidylglycerophosphatase A [Myxococcota bacterium]